jgi:(Z)-2-((N-methylformamido)methylene)-5-hydroxybutyrolactone dehydrogenase
LVIAPDAKIEAMIARAEAAGARIRLGQGHGIDLPVSGTFAAPTVLTDVSTDMEIDNEEVFGPVVVVHSFETEADAISLANQRRYGLAAGIWTNDVRHSFRVARAVRAGTVLVNAYRVLSYAVPFGGMGDS